ncbi:MAG: hypothetical protein VCF24_18760, partial [Candidatus Latescibacterota bacterium]
RQLAEFLWTPGRYGVCCFNSPYPRVFYADAPKPVEITLFHQPELKRFLVAVINFQSELPNLPVRDIPVRVKADKGRTRAVTELSPDSDITFGIEDGYVEFTVPEIQTFRQYAITYD